MHYQRTLAEATLNVDLKNAFSAPNLYRSALLAQTK